MKRLNIIDALDKFIMIVYDECIDMDEDDYYKLQNVDGIL